MRLHASGDVDVPESGGDQVRASKSSEFLASGPAGTTMKREGPILVDRTLTFGVWPGGAQPVNEGVP